MLDFKDLLGSMTVEDFEKHRGKTYCVFPRAAERTELFKHIISWSAFSQYINNDRAVSGLQAVTPKGKLCMERRNLQRKSKPNWSRRDYFEKAYLHDIWLSGGTLILTKASLLTPRINLIAGAIERYYEGAADAHFYCSNEADATSFPAHRDSDDNFLVHAYGDVDWEINRTLDNVKGNTDLVKLTTGDLLYIPIGLEHQAFPQSKRISISVPVSVPNKARGEKYLIPQDRKYYNF